VRSVEIDCEGVITSADFWQRYIEPTQPVEPGFGRNLDAFWDALNGGLGYPGDCELVFKNCGALKNLTTFGGTLMLDGLRQIAVQSEAIRVILA
jgi:ribonuclease inhibitor